MSFPTTVIPINTSLPERHANNFGCDALSIQGNDDRR